jgi:hypothetical protein
MVAESEIRGRTRRGFGRGARWRTWRGVCRVYAVTSGEVVSCGWGRLRVPSSLKMEYGTFNARNSEESSLSRLCSS